MRSSRHSFWGLKMIVNRAAWLVVSMAPLAALGCTKSVSDAPSPVGSVSASLAATTGSASGAPSGSARKPRGMFGRHGGVAGSLFRAAHELDLKEGQKASLDALEGGGPGMRGGARLPFP
jgi:hypothetical protein